jgi:hypothetical protein
VSLPPQTGVHCRSSPLGPSRFSSPVVQEPISTPPSAVQSRAPWTASLGPPPPRPPLRRAAPSSLRAHGPSGGEDYRRGQACDVAAYGEVWCERSSPSHSPQPPLQAEPNSVPSSGWEPPSGERSTACRSPPPRAG